MDKLKQMSARLKIFFARDKSMAMVRQFCETFGHPVKDKPDLSDDKQNELRHELLKEELEEFLESIACAEDVFYAINNGWGIIDYDNHPLRDKIEKANVSAFDALLDLQVVLDGAFLTLGFHRYKAAGLAEVHRSNMSKLGADGKPIYREDGKILKGPNYTAPDLRKVLGL